MASQSQTTPKWLDLLSHPAVSQTMGKLVRVRAPKPVLQAAIRGFCKLYGADPSEAERPLEDFATFQEFFTRRLKPGMRQIEGAGNLLPSPADGILSITGSLANDTLIQAKGIDYTLDALMGGKEDADPYRGGSYAIVYLAPKNYHRVHSPWDGEIERWRHIAGPLYPVNPTGIAKVPGLFARNERIIGHCQTEFGPAALIMVGATCVGHMRVCFTDLCTNEGRPTSELTTLESPMHQSRGDEFGVFEMGSTVVLVFANPDVQPALTVPSPVLQGQGILRISAPTSHPGSSSGRSRHGG
jgi:phosphatidylserine decarboxylase